MPIASQEGVALSIVASGSALDQPPAVSCMDCGARATIIHLGMPFCGHHALKRLEAESDTRELAIKAPQAEGANLGRST